MPGMILLTDAVVSPPLMVENGDTNIGPEFGGQWLWALFSLGIVLVLAYWATRFLSGKVKSVSQAKHIKVAESLCLGPNRHLYLLLVHDQVLLVGSSEQGLSLLKEYTDQDFYETLAQGEVFPVWQLSGKFKQTLDKLLGSAGSDLEEGETDLTPETRKLRDSLERIRAWRKRR